MDKLNAMIEEAKDQAKRKARVAKLFKDAKPALRRDAEDQMKAAMTRLEALLDAKAALLDEN